MKGVLSTFMSIAITAVILSVLIIGVTYSGLADKGDEQQDILQDQYNLQIK